MRTLRGLRTRYWAGKMAIEIFFEGDLSRFSREIKKIESLKLVKKILNHLKLKKSSVAIILTDNKAIKKINRKYRKKNKPTDVISFATRENPFPQLENMPEHLGDVFISIERAHEQSIVYDISIADEIKRLLVHGILHLAGYDHETSPADEVVMKKKEEEILQKLITSP